ncbi:MAG: hypothetical protein KDA79_21760, partial [Planctomycetaceae bacterium]|nr:hypothetical protein [Planctomycetaceae bacterium]
MNCKQAKHSVALRAGEEMQDDGPLREHLTVCTSCSDYRHRLHRSLHALRSCSSIPAAEEQHPTSLWPELSARLRRARLQTLPAARFNGWLPAAATVAACLLIGLYLVQQPGQPQRHYLDGSPMVEQPLPYDQLRWPALPEQNNAPFQTVVEHLLSTPERVPDRGQRGQTLDEVMTVPFWGPSLD